MELSVIVSTYNRIDDLQRLIGSLLEQNISKSIAWEIVISNNGSTDGTGEVIESLVNTSSIPIRYIYQPQKAKSYGLNAAMRAAKGNILAFTDDDIIVPVDWVQNILDYINNNPNASCIGGPVVLYNKEDKDISVRTSKSYSVYCKEDFNPVYIPIIGCNMILTRALVESVGFYDVKFGPGSYIGSGDDLDYLYRVVDSGFTLQYVPDILVFHNHGRKNLVDVSKVKKRYMIGRGAFYSKYSLKDRMVLRWAYWELSTLLKQNWYLWVNSIDSRTKITHFFWMVWGMIKWRTKVL